MARGNGRFLGQFAWVSGGRLVAAGLQAISLVLLVPLLAPSEFGLLASVMGIATVLQTVLDFGVGTYVTRERAADPESGGIPTALRFNSLTSAVMALIVLASLGLAGLIVAPVYWLMLPLAFWLSGERNADARLTVVFADGDAWINVSNLLARRVVGIGVFLALVALGIEPLLSYCAGIAIAAIGSSVFANVIVRKRVRATRTLTYRQLISASKHYWANSVATQARNLDVVIVGGFAGSVAAGFYASASRLTTPLRLLPTSLASVLIPAATRAVKSGESVSGLIRAASLLLAGVTALYLALFFAAPWFVPSVLGAAYEPATAVIQVVLLGLPFAAAVSLCNALLQAFGEKRFVAMAAALTSAFCLVSVAVMSITAGALGAGWALAASFAVQALAVGARLGSTLFQLRKRGND